MAHLIAQRVASIGRRVRTLWLLYGLGLAMSIVLGLATLLILLDYALRFEDTGIRLMATAVLAVIAVWTLYRFLWVPLSTPLTTLGIALRLERRIPQLHDRLATAIQFLSEPVDDPKSGSAELRRAAVHETSQLVESLDLHQAIDARPAIRAQAFAVAVVLIAGLLTAMSPRMALVGALRLVDPLGASVWPQQTHLALRQPVRQVASGQSFEVEVIDPSKLPEEVWMLYVQHQPDGTFTEEKQLLPVVGGAAIARREHVTHPFFYRAIGGDDKSMPWTEVRVLDPPALASVDMTLDFPEYTGWPSRPSDRQLRALAGTRVAVDGVATKPLRSAKIVYEDGREFPLNLDADQRHVSLATDAAAPLVIDKSGAYWFSFEDTGGLQGGSDLRYEMRCVPDLEPTVTIDAPPATTFVTPESTVPIHVTVTDDLAIRDIEMRYLRSDQSEQGDQSLVLYKGPEKASPPETQIAQGSDKQGERRVSEYRWQLATLKLAPGTQLTVYAAASDYQPLVGRSTSRLIQIVAPNELEQRLEERETALLAELKNVLQLEQGAKAHVAAIQVQTDQVGTVQQADLDRLHAASLSQRQVDRALTSREGGIPAHLAGLMADIENNHLDNPDLQRRTGAMLAELNRLEREHLPKIEPALTGAEKTLRSSRDPHVSAEVRSSIQVAAKSQDEVISSLERLLGELSRWDSQRRLVRDLADLHHAQRALAAKTAEVGRGTLSKSFPQLTPQQQADLKKLATEQQELARRFETAQQAMSRARDQMDQDNPVEAQGIADALARAVEQSLSGKMHESGANIERNQIGQASANQRQAAEDLEELLDILSNRREHELARLVKKLKETETELGKIREAQAGLRKRIKEVAKQPDDENRRNQLQQLAREQKQLQENAARVARKLNRLQAESSANSLARASDGMQQASSAGEQGDADESAVAAEQAERDLDEAQSQLAQRRRQAERDLATEQFAKIRDTIVALRDREQQAIAETERIDRLRGKAGELSRAQLESLMAAAKVQEALSAETRALVRRLSGVEVFALALTQAGGDMDRAVTLLRNRDTGARTVQKQQRAMGRLQQLLTALDPDQQESKPKEGEKEAGEAGGSAEGGAPGEQVPDVAQLKLVKLMQEELNRRTTELSAARTDQPAGGEAAAEYASLGEEQGRLADLIRNLTTAGEKDQSEDDQQLQRLLDGDKKQNVDSPDQTPGL